MKLGVVFPQTESGADPVAIHDYAQAAESLGYDYLLAYDHVLGANPERPGGVRGRYTHRDSFHEPLVFFGYLAAITQRLELVTGILILPQRQTALVAKQAAEVDVLSGGRLRVGIGIGWNQVEYEALNENFGNRGKRIEEQVRLLRELWTQPLVDFHGKYHTIPDAGLNPMPVQQPIPIWFGGTADAVLKRMAALGDGWICNNRVHQFPALHARLNTFLAEVGRDPQTFGLDARITLQNLPANTDAWAQEAETWRSYGVTHLCVNTMGLGFTSLSQHVETIHQFKNVVG
jgi:probable F420-dependent oxidoreductase